MPNPPNPTISEMLHQVPVTIQRMDDMETRIRGLLFGQISPNRLLLSIIDSQDLHPDETIIVRAVQGWRALGFKTAIREVVGEPFQLLFTEIPESVEEISLRKTTRLELFLPVDLRYSAGKGERQDTLLLKGNMTDISSGGCRVFTKRPVPADSVVHLSFVLPGEKRLNSLSGNVIDAFSRESIFGQRIKFFTSEKNMADLAEIRRWIQQHEDFIGL